MLLDNALWIIKASSPVAKGSENHLSEKASISKGFLSPSVHMARRAHMHRFLTVCVDFKLDEKLSIQRGRMKKSVFVNPQEAARKTLDILDFYLLSSGCWTTSAMCFKNWSWKYSLKSKGHAAWSFFMARLMFRLACILLSNAEHYLWIRKPQ